MSEAAEMKKRVKTNQTGSPRKGGVRRAVSVRVGQRTFPSETARRLLATMALDNGNPRALLNLTGGVVGHVDSVVPNPDLLSDSDSSTAEVAEVGECDAEREGCGSEKKKFLSNKKKRKKSINACAIPSKPQMARTFSKCIPKQDVVEFERLFNSYQGLTSCPSGCDNRRIDPNALIIKTRVVTILWALQRLYGCENVVCESTDEICGERVDGKVVEKSDYLEIVAMDAVLARTLNPPRAVTGTETVDTPVRFLAQEKEHLDKKYDPMFRAFVVVVPDGATYYCHRERRRACIGVTNALIPMDTSWLRAKRNGTATDRFALGGYISRLWDGQPFWKFKISRGVSNFKLRPIPGKAGASIDTLSWDPNRRLKVLSVYQVADEIGPALPPDHIGGQWQRDDWPSLRRAYRAAINLSRSSKRGCRHYAQSHLHFRIDPEKTLVIDSKDQDWDLRIATQVKRAGDERKLDKNGRTQSRLALARDSVVQIRSLMNLGSGGRKLVNDVWEHARSAVKGNKQSARRGLGDVGSMHPIGMRVMKDNKTRTRYKTSRAKHEQRALRKAIIAAARLAAVTIPGILRLIQDVEEDGDIAPPEGGMNGGGIFHRVSFTMDVSFDLANASHVDVNDASQGFSIWTEDDPGGTKEWYFVLPNVYGRRPNNPDGTPGGVFHGVAIKLTHGVLISWDGRVIRHCTSMMERPDESKHVYGSFFAAKSSVVAFGARMAFVRECLRRYHAKLERRHRRKGKADPNIVGTGVVVDGGGDVDGDAVANNNVNEVDKLMAAQVPRKSISDAVSSSDEMLLDDEESWSDFTYASCVAESNIVGDSGTITERIPFVEFLDSGLDENVEYGGTDVARLPVHGSRNDGDYRLSRDWVATSDVDERGQTSSVARHPIWDYTACEGGRKRSREDQWRRDLYGRRARSTGRELDCRESKRFESQATYFDNSRVDQLNWHESELNWRQSERSESRATYYDSSRVDQLHWHESERFESRTTFYDNSQVGVPRDGQHQRRSAPVGSYDEQEGFLRARGPNNLPTRDYESLPARRNTDVREEWDGETGLWRHFRR